MRLAALLTLFLLAAPSARAAPEDVACIDVTHPDCTLTPDTLEAALASAAHVIRLGTGPYAGDLASADPVEIAGMEGTVVSGGLALTGKTVTLHNLRIEGTLALGSGTAAIDDADLAALELDHTDLTGRGLTVTGGVTAAGGTVVLTSSVVAAPDPFAVSEDAAVTTGYSAHTDDEDASATQRVDPPADPRRVTGTALVDAGDPAPLAPYEPFEDAAGAPRIAAGRRDVGAYEAQPSPLPIPARSVLVNGGAEQGLDGWSGTFAPAAFGAPFLPSQRTGLALGAEQRFFSGGEAPTPELFQRVDVAGAAAAIDRGGAQAELSGLVGGYGADADTLSVRAVFKDPENVVLGELALESVTQTARRNDTTLLHREVRGEIPARTRAIDVLLGAERKAGSYTDAYADNLGLVLTVPSDPPDPGDGPDDPPVDDLKPFNGVSVLTAEPRFNRAGVGEFTLACLSTTVGACSGSLELDARLPGSAKVKRIARYSLFRVRRGEAKTVVVRLLAAVRAKLAKRRSLAATLIAIARDGQGLQRRADVPVTLDLPARARRRRGSSPRSAGSGGAHAPRRAARRSAA